MALYDLKQRWFVVTLSWLLPGSGHVYSGAMKSGICLLLFKCSIVSLFWFSLVLPIFDLGISVFLGSINFIILPVFASISSLKITKRALPNRRYANNAKDPWLAFFLSILWPGLGHIYIKKWWWLIFYTVLILMMPTTGIFLVLLVFLRLFSCFHSYISAIRIRCESWHHLFSPLLIIPVVFYVGRYIFLIFIMKFCISILVISSESMEPTVCRKDMVVSNRLEYLFKNPEPNEIVLFVCPEELKDIKGQLAVKRIIAKSGSEVSIKNNIVFVDGHIKRNTDQNGLTLKEDRKSVDQSLHYWLKQYAFEKPYKVPQKSYFLLGDNFYQSADSRYFGAIPRRLIKGKVIKIIWPPNRAKSLCSDEKKR